MAGDNHDIEETQDAQTAQDDGKQQTQEDRPQVGGNGTVWASNKTAYTYFRIDTASTPGYITVAS